LVHGKVTVCVVSIVWLVEKCLSPHCEEMTAKVDVVEVAPKAKKTWRVGETSGDHTHVLTIDTLTTKRGKSGCHRSDWLLDASQMTFSFHWRFVTQTRRSDSERRVRLGTSFAERGLRETTRFAFYSLDLEQEASIKKGGIPIVLIVTVRIIARDFDHLHPYYICLCTYVYEEPVNYPISCQVMAAFRIWNT